jgi:hypothetical protein
VLTVQGGRIRRVFTLVAFMVAIGIRQAPVMAQVSTTDNFLRTSADASGVIVPEGTLPSSNTIGGLPLFLTYMAVD